MDDDDEVEDSWEAVQQPTASPPAQPTASPPASPPAQPTASPPASPPALASAPASAASSASALVINLGPEDEATPRSAEAKEAREARRRRGQVHSAHLLCLLAHVVSRSRVASNRAVQDAVLPHVPERLRPSDSAAAATTVDALKALVAWWTSAFRLVVDHDPALRLREPTTGPPVLEWQRLPPPHHALLERATAMDGTAAQSAELLAALLRRLGWRTRLVHALRPLSLRAAPGEAVYHVPTTASDAAGPPGPAAPLAAADAAAQQPTAWIEAYATDAARWIAVDPVHALVDEPHRMDAPLGRGVTTWTPLVYVVAVNESARARDVTKRYAAAWGARTLKLRAVAAPWWATAVDAAGGRRRADASVTQDTLEDAELDTRAAAETLPATVDAYRNHPLYALERHLKRAECIYPTVPILGYCRGEPVYPRANIKALRSREAWLKDGRVVKDDAVPAKVVKAPKAASPKGRNGARAAIPAAVAVAVDEDDDGEGGGSQVDASGLVDGTPLFGIWQTDVYTPRTAVNGLVPKNQYGNVDLFQPSMLPTGTVHLTTPGLGRLARHLGIDFGEAVTGFEFRGRRAIPVRAGIVVCSEYADTLMARSLDRDRGQAHAEEQHRAVIRARQERERAALQLWRRLVRKVVLHQQLQARHPAPAPAATTAPDAAADRAAADPPTPSHDAHVHAWIDCTDVMTGDDMQQCAECGVMRPLPAAAPLATVPRKKRRT